MKPGFTLVEVIIVMIILGILATLGLTQYGGVRERALDREAQANLRLIIAAAKIYRMEIGYYAALDTTDVINDNFRLLLPTPATPNWDYSTTADNVAIPPATCAEATRPPAVRTWRLRDTDDEPRNDPPNNTCP